jgi:hypothetical protein
MAFRQKLLNMGAPVFVSKRGSAYLLQAKSHINHLARGLTHFSCQLGSNTIRHNSSSQNPQKTKHLSRAQPPIFTPEQWGLWQSRIRARQTIN